MSAVQLPIPSVERHANRQLFSDYYLNSILPTRSDWKQLALDASAAMREIKQIVQRSGFVGRDGGAPNEAQTEDGLVKPVLTALGHAFQGQVALSTSQGTKKPDYVFYNDDTTRLANLGRTLNDTLLRGAAYAVGDAKAWDRDLDKVTKGGNDPLTNHPSLQIAFYIQHSGLAWGILTNGRLWRLYHKDSSHKLDRFYQVDLPALLEADDEEAFLYFYAFFRRDAFKPGPLGVAEILQASNDYARGVGNTLKSQVYEALHHMAQGFLDYQPNQLEPDPATLRQIYDSSLIALYRLLFILYAEARELLPVRESQLYRDRYSLYAITHDIERDLRAGVDLLNDSDTLWPRLKRLFTYIDKGNPQLKVATFNGGLFDPQRHAFLDRYVVGDGHLQKAIDMLARVKGEFVDYRDLAERHLGTIYEGLLEFHLELEPGAARRVALVNERGERHRTGSYYTPDYIVKYIVDQTVGPMLEAAVAAAESDQQKLAAVLAVNVLDPSMGSGHFLVEATEYIARFLVQLNIQPAEQTGEADLAYWKRRVAQSCIYGVDLNPLAVELAKLSLWLITVAKDRPLSFLDHHLRCGNALVGARLSDLNAGKGDAGAQKRARKRLAQAEAAGQLALFGDDEFRRNMSSAVDSMWLIERNQGNTVEDVRQQEQLYRLLHETLTRKYGKLADLATAARFGVAVDQALWQPLADYVTGKSIAALPKFSAWVEQSAALARQHRFFHWELEFPEVFFDQHGYPLGERAGFDAVVGNPPYVRQEALAPIKPYLTEAYAETFHGMADLFVYFFSQGLNLLQEGGLTSYISSNSWLRANYAVSLRSYLRTKTVVNLLIDLGDNRVFADAPDVYPAIHVVRKATPPATYSAQVAAFSRGEGLENFGSRVASKLAPVSIHDQDDSGWQLGDDAGRRLFAKLMAGGKPLGDIVNGQFYRGVLTGLNDAFIIDEATRNRLVKDDPSSDQIIRPILRGEDLRPWYFEDEGRWVIFARRGIDIDSYPAIKNYLLQFRDRLEPRPKEWPEGQHWGGRKPGPYQWYEIQDSVDYYEAFDKPKFFWADIGKFPRFSWDTSGTYVNDKGFIGLPPDISILGILQSRIAWLCISHLCVPLGERAGSIRYQQKSQFISRLPIPDMTDEERAAIGKLAMELTTLARERYELHRKSHRRILSDLGQPTISLNQKLMAWWQLSFPAFREEIKKVFKRDIPLADRDDWEEWLEGRRIKHEQLTAEIVRLEAELNARVYALFDLTPEEIAIVEESTKYKYGEV